MPTPLYPTWAMPPSTIQIAQTAPPIIYPPSVAFDFDVGDFVLDGRGNPAPIEGETAWAIWCVKAVSTQRLAYPVYNQNYGADLDTITSAPNQPLAQAAAQGAISRALLADPRTKSVTAFTFSWAGDALNVSFLVTPTVGTGRTLTVKLSYP